jgi:hypothetical protein
METAIERTLCEGTQVVYRDSDESREDLDCVEAQRATRIEAAIDGVRSKWQHTFQESSRRHEHVVTSLQFERQGWFNAVTRCRTRPNMAIIAISNLCAAPTSPIFETD